LTSLPHPIYIPRRRLSYEVSKPRRFKSLRDGGAEQEEVGSRTSSRGPRELERPPVVERRLKVYLDAVLLFSKNRIRIDDSYLLKPR
jgi:hypothetical protein